MTDDELRAQTLELADVFLELLRKPDWDGWIELWADDGVLEFPYAPADVPSRVEGKDAILAYMKDAVTVLKLEPTATRTIFPMLDPQMLVMDAEIRSHLISTGEPYNQRYVKFLEYDDGKLQRCVEYWNPLVSIDAYRSREAWTAAFASRCLAPQA